MKIINVGKEFHHRLANRNKHQGDGKYNAVDFRNRYLSQLDDETEWKNSEPFVTLDFADVKKIGPSFANEAFAYFMKYTDPEFFKKKVNFKNLSKVQEIIINEELQSGNEKG